jgi:peptidoglycan/LPS O-acetylase OafA/YrhL
MSEPALKTHARDPNLDALRALAILLVLLYHSPLESGLYLSYLKVNGGLGVQLFFVLSGFLIGGIFFRERQRAHFNLLHFWSRRWLRTIPPYVALVAIWWTGNWLKGSPKPLNWSYTCFFQNYLMFPREHMDMPFTWSLCVEEHFYLTAPLLLLFLGTSHARMACFLGLALIPMAVRLVGWGDPLMTHVHFDPLIYGVTLAYLQVHSRPTFEALQAWGRRLFPLSLVGFVLVLVFAGNVHGDKEISRLTFANLIFAWWLLAVAGRAPIWLARSRVTYWIAVTSYSCYLIHGYAYETAKRLPSGTAWPLRWTVLVVGTVVCTAVFYFTAELGALRLRELLSPAEKKAAKQQPQTAAVALAGVEREKEGEGGLVPIAE